MSHWVQAESVNAKDVRSARFSPSDNRQIKTTSDGKKESLTVKREIKILGHTGDGSDHTTVGADVHAHHPLRTSSQQIEMGGNENKAIPIRAVRARPCPASHRWYVL
jgi:hypothetical protein